MKGKGCWEAKSNRCPLPAQKCEPAGGRAVGQEVGAGLSVSQPGGKGGEGGRWASAGPSGLGSARAVC